MFYWGNDLDIDIRRAALDGRVLDMNDPCSEADHRLARGVANGFPRGTGLTSPSRPR